MESLSLFQHKVTPHVLGILWLTNDEFSPELESYHSLNYFLDGLFSSQIGNKGETSSKKLFITESFGRPFFVSHIIKTPRLKKEIENILDVAQNFQGSKDTIFFLDKTKKFEPQEWEKKYPQLKFENLITS